VGSGAFVSPRMKGPELASPIRSFGPRRRNKGRMGVLVRVPPYVSRAGTRKRKTVMMRSQSGSTRQTEAGFEVGQDKPYQTKNLPGKFKAVMPRNRIRFP
jgi:hypothetical protein